MRLNCNVESAASWNIQKGVTWNSSAPSALFFASMCLRERWSGAWEAGKQPRPASNWGPGAIWQLACACDVSGIPGVSSVGLELQLCFVTTWITRASSFNSAHLTWFSSHCNAPRCHTESELDNWTYLNQHFKVETCGNHPPASNMSLIRARSSLPMAIALVTLSLALWSKSCSSLRPWRASSVGALTARATSVVGACFCSDWFHPFYPKNVHSKLFQHWGLHDEIPGKLLQFHCLQSPLQGVAVDPDEARA